MTAVVVGSEESARRIVSRPAVHCLVLGGLAFAITTFVLVRSAFARGQDWSFDSLGYHTTYGYASLFERSRLGYPMSLGAYFNPMLDAPLGWGVRHLTARTVTIGIVIVQSAAIATAAALPWHCLTGRVVPAWSGRWQFGKTELLWAATYGLSAYISFGALSRIQLGATWGDLTSALPAIIALHLLVGWVRSGSARMLLVAGALVGVACGLKYTNGPNLMGGAMFVTVVALHRRDEAGTLRACLRELRRFLVGCLVGAAVCLGPWAIVETVRFGNPLFPFGGRRFNHELITTTGGYVDLGATTFPIRSLGDFFGTPIRLLNRTTAITEFPVRDPRLLFAACACAIVLIVSVRTQLLERRSEEEGSTPTAERAVVLAFAFAAYWAVTYTAWAYLFGNGRYLELVELLTPAMVCLAVVAATSWRGLESVRSNRRLLTSAVVLAVIMFAANPLTVSPDYGHVPFARRWYDLNTSALPTLRDAMVVVPYEFEPLDFVEFVLSPRSFVRLNVQLLPTRLGQREIRRVASYSGRIYSFQATNAGDPNLDVAGLRRTGLCYPVPLFQGYIYHLCELEKIR